MFEYYVWILVFVFLYVSIFWIIVFSLKEKEYPEVKTYPKISIVVPAYNEEKNIEKTLDSLINLDYPKDKLKIIVVDDCSSDKTSDITKRFHGIQLIRRETRGGNAAVSLNTAIRNVDTELVARVDADSYVQKDSLKKLIKYFSDENVGAVISTIFVNDPKNSLEYIQRLEYIITNFTRKLMSKLGTLHFTNGVLSIYRTNILKKLGYFEEGNLTEDYEIALRFRKNGYNVIMSSESKTFTHVPNKFSTFWRQRIRWYRGFIYNNIKYRGMLFNKQYGLLGLFQMPVMVFSMFLVFFSFLLFIYQTSDKLYDFIYKVITLKQEILSMPKIPNIVDFILSIDIRIYAPVFLSLIFSLYIYFQAHKFYNETRIYPIVTVIYLFIYPIITSIQWFCAILYDSLKLEKKW